jgi:multidrug efflux pump subunit AcrA (membrane-fusion protein)
MRTQLTQTTTDLHECRTQLHAALDTSQQLQSLLAAASAAKAALERRVGALKLLLAEQVGENARLVQGLQLCQEGLEAARLQLQHAESQQAAARAEIASKVRMTHPLGVTPVLQCVGADEWVKRGGARLLCVLHAVVASMSAVAGIMQLSGSRRLALRVGAASYPEAPTFLPGSWHQLDAPCTSTQ